MLNPDARGLYTNSVCPPPGYIFDQAIATTYSLDPATMLTLPTHLALAERPSSAPPDPIKLLESLRRLSDRFSVYVDHTGIKAPSTRNLLYGFLESMVIPVRAPRGGVFHPKIWALRFIEPDLDAPPLIRLLVLSRNITFDRSWDIALQLEGRPGLRYIGANRPLGELIQALPAMSVQPVSETRRLQAEQLAEEIRKTDWELPEGYESADFHVLGINRRAWSPPRSRRMAVVSPFLTDNALSWLRNQTDKLVAVISRPEALNELEPAPEERWFTLDDAAETEDSEEADRRDTLGLHAKVYVLEKGAWTRLYLGSANVTSASLLERSNVEVLVELTGKTSRVGGIDTLLGDSGLGSLLSEYVRPEEGIQAEDAEEVAALRALDSAKAVLAEAELKVLCKPDGDASQLTLLVSREFQLPGIARLAAWPITVAEDRAVDVMGITQSKSIELGRYATESITGLIAFELATEIKNLKLRLVLNLPIEGLPENRDDAIFRLVLNNREGFLRYLRLLLGEDGAPFGNEGSVFGGGDGNGGWSPRFSDEVPILEELARAFSRNPEKLKDVRAVLDRLKKNPDKASIIPPDFVRVWTVFEDALREAGC
ncbi:MAG: hypothetical protein A4E72_00357 [Syntrophus sp. PtaU1.Bin208]|nr:MAG: hypothetical protein A4E72_00357 [Syntrophus sp. PtaU1.Bin208]